MYRNYSNNKAKFIKNNGEICWEEEPMQVAFLNSEEFKFWIEHFQGREEFPQMIITAAEGFQELGMHTVTEDCLALLEQENSQQEDLIKRLYLTKYSRYTALGYYDKAEEILDLIKTQLQNNPDPMYEIKVMLITSWYQAKIGNALKAEALCNKGIVLAKELRDEFPFSAYLVELEFRRNRVYALRNLPSKDSEGLRIECQELLKKALDIYAENPDNRTALDIIGFACNLYGTYSFDSIINNTSISDVEKEIEKINIFKITDLGISIRKQAVDKQPNNIWAIRGYTWSLHSKARHLMNLSNDYKSSEELLVLARDIRNKEKNRKDLGLYEDIVKNYIDLYQARGSRSEIIIEISKKISPLMDAIFEKEGYTPRMKLLHSTVLKVGLVCSNYSSEV